MENKVSNIERKAILISIKGIWIQNVYKGNYVLALQRCFPKTDWNLFAFKHSLSMLHDIQNHRQYFDWIGEQLDVKEYSDWYNISRSQVVELGAISILQFYNNSLPKGKVIFTI
jgi:hypothetical protein